MITSFASRLRRRPLWPAAIAVLLLAAIHAVEAQYRLQPVAEHPSDDALGLALRRLASVGTLMMTTAHPDDENNALLAMYRHRDGLRTVLVTATRGNGGQNEIGPELFEALAVLRTEELLAAHRLTGTEQYFTRAVDFGNSFSRDETFERWNREEILADYVRHIRTIRPDVIVGFLWDHTQGSGQHHQASTAITAEAFRAAADPDRFPEQIAAGLRPWQASKFFYTAPFFGGQAVDVPADDICVVDANVFDPLIGRTYNELGSEARSLHMCQGMPQLYLLPGPLPRQYVLRDTVLETPRAEQTKDIMAGIDTRIRSLGRFGLGGSPALPLALEALEGQVRNAQFTYETKGVNAARPILAQVLGTVRALRRQLPGMQPDAALREEIDMRLERKEREAEEALRIAAGLRIDVLADDGLIVAGQPVGVSARVFAGAAEDVSVRSVTFEGFDGNADCAAATVASPRPFVCEATLRVPASARVTTAYWTKVPGREYYDFDPDVPFGVPFAPSPFVAKIVLSLGGHDQTVAVPVQYRHGGNVFSGEKRHELLVVPRLAVKLGSDVLAFPGVAQSRELRVTVTNHGKGPADASVELALPDGWRSEPASAPVSFAREDEQLTVRFQVTPDAAARPGRYDVAAVATLDGERYTVGYETIEYPHISRRHLAAEARGSLQVLDLQPVDVTVGYIMGVGDLVPPALEQLGARVELLTPEQVAYGDLGRYDVVMTGVRAYERRTDLRAYNQRLLDYAEAGGTVIVQYNKFEFNQAQHGPYPGKVSSNRVTDETAPVTVLVPDHPVFTTPNRVTDETWAGWVQERGLYFFDTASADERYVDLIEMSDPFPNNPGVQRGALVEARVGKGRWLYVGLNLWRQLPAGTPGAYTLMANLLSLGKS
jgi:LmbE family N-acetylglucosaminyl deacetylase